MLGFFIAVKGHYDYGSSYKSKHLIEVARFQFQSFSPLLSAWGHVGRCSLHHDSEATGG